MPLGATSTQMEARDTSRNRRASVFGSIDLDNDGFISRDDFYSYLQQAGSERIGSAAISATPQETPRTQTYVYDATGFSAEAVRLATPAGVPAYAVDARLQ